MRSYHKHRTFIRKEINLKKVVKYKNKMYKKKLIENLSRTCKDTKDFWQVVDKLVMATNGMKKEPNSIKPDTWIQYFSVLMNKEHVLNVEYRNIIQFIQDKKNWQLFNELSFTIEVNEIEKAIAKLKNGKGIDLIKNEMLKYGKEVLTKPLKLLFNYVLLSGVFPTALNISWLKPLHKGGKTTDPNRYRGISLSSCIGKLFCTILNNRLVNYLTDNNLNSEYQIGFQIAPNGLSNIRPHFNSKSYSR